MNRTIGKVIKAVHHGYWLHCPVCWKVTDHRMTARGNREFYTCKKCKNVQEYTVK